MLSRLARYLLLANVIAQIGIVVTGGLVRLTGSGLGCPTWPQCVEGSYVPVLEQEMGIHPYIEFGNRTLTGLVGLTAVAVLVIAIDQVLKGRTRSLLLPGFASLLLVAVQAGIGGITVLTQLHPFTVSVHFMVSMLLIAASVFALIRLDSPDGPRRPTVRPEVRRLAWAVAATGFVVLCLGTVVTGSGPHSGDAQAPARYGFDPRTVSWLHADAVMIFVGLLIGLVVALRLVQAPRPLRRAAWWTVGVTAFQGVVGYAQYFLGLPEVLVLAHMLGAALLVVTLTGLVVHLGTRTPQREPSPAPAGAGLIEHHPGRPGLRGGPGPGQPVRAGGPPPATGGR